MTREELAARLAEADRRLRLLRRATLELREAGRAVLRRRRDDEASDRDAGRGGAEPRPTGVDRELEVPESFFEPLPPELLDAFEGREREP